MIFILGGRSSQAGICWMTALSSRFSGSCIFFSIQGTYCDWDGSSWPCLSFFPLSTTDSSLFSLWFTSTNPYFISMTKLLRFFCPKICIEPCSNLVSWTYVRQSYDILLSVRKLYFFLVFHTYVLGRIFFGHQDLEFPFWTHNLHSSTFWSVFEHRENRYTPSFYVFSVFFEVIDLLHHNFHKFSLRPSLMEP